MLRNENIAKLFFHVLLKTTACSLQIVAYIYLWIHSDCILQVEMINLVKTECQPRNSNLRTHLVGEQVIPILVIIDDKFNLNQSRISYHLRELYRSQKLRSNQINVALVGYFSLTKQKRTSHTNSITSLVPNETYLKNPSEPHEINLTKCQK